MPDMAPAALEGGRRHARLVGWRWLRASTFAPNWLPVRWRHPAAGYVFAVLVQVLAILLTFVFAAVLRLFELPTALDFAAPVALVLLGVVLVALNWGALPSVVAAVVGAELLDFVALPPRLVWALDNFQDAVGLAVLVGVGLAISLLTASAEQSKRQAEEERAEAQARELTMRQMQERVDEFLAVASHDLRSPLTAASGFLDLAARHHEQLTAALVDTRPELAGRAEAVRASLHHASQAEERLRRLVDLLFDTTQARAGKLNLVLAPCDLQAVVRDQVVALRVANPHRTLQLEELADQPVQVVADADRIGQVVTNYLTNALKYSPADHPVVIRVASEGAWTRVAVADQGPGLPAGEHERIWQRFYQADGVRPQSRSRGSLGLGLHICKAIIEGHGGRVGVESEVGKGSTFWFVLPLARGRLPMEV
jgi:signal transduction histidine kinase